MGIFQVLLSVTRTTDYCQYEWSEKRLLLDIIGYSHEGRRNTEKTTNNSAASASLRL